VEYARHGEQLGGQILASNGGWTTVGQRHQRRQMRRDKRRRWPSGGRFKCRAL